MRVHSDDSSAPTSSRRSRIGLWLGPLLFFGVWLLADLEPGKPEVTAMAAVALLMATWWVTEAVPIPVTALVPIVLFPVLGIMSGDATAGEYMDWLIFLFLGGFLIAIAVEKWGLHKRIALRILALIGGQPRRVVLGFMVATAFLSMWLSNTATTMMMMPMALSLIFLFEELDRKRIEVGGVSDARSRNFGLVLMLGLAYAASIGGLATLIGTPPNGVLVSQLSTIFPDAPRLSFARWMVFATPFSAVFLIVSWFLLTRLLYPLPRESFLGGKEFIREEIRRLGPISTEEKRVGTVFVMVALLWITRSDIPFGQSGEGLTIRGWAYWLDRLLESAGRAPVGHLIDDGTVSIVMALSLFIIPTSKKHGGRLMDWESAKKVPWGILLLFGGGLALARGFTDTGLSKWIGNQFEGVLDGAPAIVVVASVVAVIEALTELTSNTATASMSLPIMASLAQAIEVHPLMLMIPAVLAASCAFVLPVSTPPNAIVYGSDRVPIWEMIKAGIVMEIMGLILITVAVFTLGAVVFGLLGPVPEWSTTR